MRALLGWVVVAAVLGLTGQAALGQTVVKDESRRKVLVELFTSQGCDMCPTAESILGKLGEANTQIVPVALHVDYFNEPWHDVFSDPLYSQRQATYNELYKGPKNAEYGLYYTPMLMVDGVATVNGRDPATAEATIRKALARKPAVDLEVTLTPKDDGRSGTVTARVASRSARAERSPLLLAAVLREDKVVTAIGSGENAGKSLVARYPARQTRFETIELTAKTPATRQFTFTLDPDWDRSHLRLAVFVQDKRTGEVHQAADLPWQTAAAAARSTTEPRAAKSAP